MPCDRNDPGETVLTKMPSGARVWLRFFEKLVSAAFDAVYAINSGA